MMSERMVCLELVSRSHIFATELFLSVNLLRNKMLLCVLTQCWCWADWHIHPCWPSLTTHSTWERHWPVWNDPWDEGLPT